MSGLPFAALIMAKLISERPHRTGHHSCHNSSVVLAFDDGALTFFARRLNPRVGRISLPSAAAKTFGGSIAGLLSG
jgi:hypothetical protein